MIDPISCVELQVVAHTGEQIGILGFTPLSPTYSIFLQRIFFAHLSDARNASKYRQWPMFRNRYLKQYNADEKLLYFLPHALLKWEKKRERERVGGWEEEEDKNPSIITKLNNFNLLFCIFMYVKGLNKNQRRFHHLQIKHYRQHEIRKRSLSMCKHNQRTRNSTITRKKKE